MSVAERIQALVNQAPMPIRRLEALAGLRRGALQKIIDGGSKDPRGSTLVACAHVLGTTSDWLAAGIGDAPSPVCVRRAVADAERAHVGSAKLNGRRPGTKAARSAA